MAVKRVTKKAQKTTHDVKSVVMNILSMYAITGTDMISPTRNKDIFWWYDEIRTTLMELFEIKPDIAYSYGNSNFDCYTVAWKQGAERFEVFVKVA